MRTSVSLQSFIHGDKICCTTRIHCIVPGGGLNSLGKWACSRKKFFVPVKVLSRKFRGKFLFYLKQAYHDGQLQFFGDDCHLLDEIAFNHFLTPIYTKEWVVYCKPPFKSAACVVEYLGRYTHRVAISNNRIISMKDGMVTFKWRDYKDGNQWKTMRVSAQEFIRRFLIHVLPDHFMKIRHYGFLSSRNKTTTQSGLKRQQRFWWKIIKSKQIHKFNKINLYHF